MISNSNFISCSVYSSSSKVFWIDYNSSLKIIILNNDFNRRIIINGTEFTDYFELSEQQELINHGEDIFSNWQDHDRQIHDKNVNILNA